MRRPPLVDLATYAHPFVTPRELATYLPCDPRTILRMIDAQSLHAYRVGRNWRVPIAEARRAFPCPLPSAMPPRKT
jgi:excisionase family DNA binding protein